MIRTPILLLAGALALLPVAARADPRLMTIAYQADEVVALHGRLGYQSMIEFASGEKIENVAVGDSSGWQVTPNKRANLLFLKPLAAGARTNMTVVTDQRVYLFDLAVAGAGRTPVYNLRFTYGPGRTPAPAVAEFMQASAPAPQPLNFAWHGDGKKQLLPVRAFDDGRSLYLSFPKDEPLPALFARSADGIEGPVDFHQAGSYIVVAEVPAVLVLRHGKRMATLTNQRRPGPPLRTAERAR